MQLKSRAALFPGLLMFCGCVALHARLVQMLNELTESQAFQKSELARLKELQTTYEKAIRDFEAWPCSSLTTT